MAGILHHEPIHKFQFMGEPINILKTERGKKEETLVFVFITNLHYGNRDKWGYTDNIKNTFALTFLALI